MLIPGEKMPRISGAQWFGLWRLAATSHVSCQICLVPKMAPEVYGRFKHPILMAINNGQDGDETMAILGMCLIFGSYL